AAVALNLSAALLTLGFVSRTQLLSPPVYRESTGEAGVGGGCETNKGVRVSICIAMALSGMAALGSEVVWTRAMGLVLGATVYAFSIILAVYLAGLALGTAAACALSRNLSPRLAL